MTRTYRGCYPKLTMAQQVKLLATVMNPGKEHLPSVSLPKPKRAYKPRPNARKPHNQPEEKLLQNIIIYLRLQGMKCGRVRTIARMIMGIYAKDRFLFKSVPDILVYNPVKKKWWWIETKAGNNKLSKRQPMDKDYEYSQEEFRDWCLESGQGWIEARSITDVEIIIKEET